MLRVIGVVVVVVLVAFSAAASAKFRRSALERSVADYRVCLDAHPWELKACYDKRLAMEAKEHDLLHAHLRTNPYGVDDDIAPKP